MRKIYPLFFAALLPLCNYAQSSCNHPVDSDNFSNASVWTATGAGNVTVSNGACTFANAQDAAYDRVYRPLAMTLSDNYFKAEFNFTIGGNPSGRGVGTNIFALAAGSLDPISYDASQSYALTNQDGFIIEIVSPTTSDNNINNWDLVLDYKDGATRTTGVNTISLNSSVLTYYAVFERTSPVSTTIRLYTDAAHTQLFGTMTNSTVSTVIGLNYIHHGVTTFGNSLRMFNGTVDDVVICDSIAVDSCSHQVVNETFSSSAGWISAGAGLVTVSSGVCDFNNANCSVYDRVYRPLPSALSNTYFKAQFEFTVVPNASGAGYGVNLLGLCAGTLDPLSYDGSQSYATTNQNGLVVIMTGPQTDNNISNAYIMLEENNGGVLTPSTQTIPLNASILTYYVKMERVSTTQVNVSVYSDGAFTQLVGTLSHTISASISGLTHEHHGITTFGSYYRYFNGSVDNVVICDDMPDGIVTNGNESSMSVYPNPSGDGQVNLNFGGHHPDQLSVYDALGQLVLSKPVLASENSTQLNLPSGFFMIVIEEKGQRFVFRQIVE